jgi:integrase
LPADLNKLTEASHKGRTRFFFLSLIYLGAEHGASRQEALSLEWTDIDFEYKGQ